MEPHAALKHLPLCGYVCLFQTAAKPVRCSVTAPLNKELYSSHIGTQQFLKEKDSLEKQGSIIRIEVITQAKCCH